MVTQVLSQSLFELISQVVVYRSCIAHCKLNISFQSISLTPLGPELKHNLYLNYIETENLAKKTTFGLMEKWSYLWSGHYKLSGGETKNFRWTKSIQRSKNILLLQFQNMEDISVRRGRKLISGLYYLCKCKNNPTRYRHIYKTGLSLGFLSFVAFDAIVFHYLFLYKWKLKTSGMRLGYSGMRFLT